MANSGEPRWWKTLWAVPALSAAALIALSVGAVRYSESPGFCRSCHIMEPYYKAWSNSKHNKVACVECHYPPGTPKTMLWKKFQALSQVAKYVTRTYSSKPYAEVDDQSCLRSGCHSTRLLDGRIHTKTNIRFDHRPHLTQPRRDRRLRCTSCHSQMVVGRHIEVTYESCYLCHFKGRGEGRDLKPLGGCMGCHEMPTRTFPIAGMQFNHKDFVQRRGLSCQSCHVNLVHGKGDVAKDRCLSCHNQPEKIARFSDVAFMHERHVTEHDVACFHCHDAIRHGFSPESRDHPTRPGGALKETEASQTGPAPSPPWPPSLAFDCVFCHQGMHAGQLEMYTGKAGPFGLPELPSPMHLASVDCVGCHFQEKTDDAREFRGRTYQASKTACGKCHGRQFRGIWEDTRSELSATLEQMEAKSRAVAKALAGAAMPPREKKGLERELGLARNLLRFVRAGRGEHNIYLSSLALRKADASLTRSAEGAKAQSADLGGLPLLSGNYCATLCHARVGVKVPPETVRAFGRSMPHQAHAGMMGCVDCHDIGGHKKVPLLRNVRAKCAQCHP